MKYIPVYKVELVREKNMQAESKRVNNPQDAAEIARDYLAGVDREHFAVMMLDTKNNVIGISTVSTGSLNASIVHPRECFKPAILHNANSIILLHNHPSGDPAPSQEDTAITKRLADAGELLGIKVFDHVIIGDGSGKYISMKELGII